jgi:HEAT repeat protein
MRPFSVRRPFGLSALVLGLATAFAATFAPPARSQPQPQAQAQTTKPEAKAGATSPAKPADVKPAIAKIKTGDESAIKEALDELRIAGPGGAAAAPAVAEALGKGLSPGLTKSAIETLGDLESESASAVLAQYATHRNLLIRRAAVKALTRTKGTPAIAAFRHALSDGDPGVRSTAASGLGALKAKDAVADLFLALDHRVDAAAASIGQLCNPAQCEELTNKLGKHPFDVVTGGLDQVLFRPQAEIPDDTKVKVIGRIRELGTIEGNKFLRNVQGRWPSNGSKRVRQSIDQAVLATSGGAQ